MRQILLLTFTLLVGTFASMNFATAQSQPWISQGWGVGIAGGVGYAFCDISSKERDSKEVFGFSIQKNLVPYLDLKGNFMFGALQGHKNRHIGYWEPIDDKTPVSLSFYSNYFMYNGTLKFLFTDFLVGHSRGKFAAYLQAGTGLIHFQSTLYDSKTNEIKAKSGKDIAATFPLGMGFEFRFTPAFSLALDFTGHLTNSSKIDVTPIATTRDMIFTSTIGVNYVFRKKENLSFVVSKQDEQPVPVVPKTISVVPQHDENTASQTIITPQVVDSHSKDTSSTPVTGNQVVDNQSKDINSTLTLLNGLVYRVQIAALQNYNANNAMNLKNKYALPQIPFEEVGDGFYKYTIGQYILLADAKIFRDILVDQGVKDAFIVPYYNGKRISHQQARELSQQK